MLSSLTPLILINTAQAQLADSPWPMFGQNLQHTGRSPYAGPEIPELKWSFLTGQHVGSPAIGADGTIYVGSSDHRLYAITPDGTEKWDFLTGGGVGVGPAIETDGTIYFGSSGDSRLYAITPDGTEKWSFITGGDFISSLAIGADGTIYFGFEDPYELYALGGEAPPPPTSCFIATAAYGTPMAEEVEILREFRDEYLLTNPLGQALVGFYYRVSPPIAEFIAEHPILKPIVRAGLVPAVAMSTIAVNTTLAENMTIVGLLVLVSVALAVWAKRRRGRGPEYT